MRKNALTLLFVGSLLCFSGTESTAQLRRDVLFLGNSYTNVNNLPQLVHDVALSAGDTLVFDSHAPGGYQLVNHAMDATSQNKIMTGGWDYVVIQGQSQEPIVQSTQFNNGGFALYNLIKQYNPCAVTVPYMTWGRKNGDASNCPSFPVMCTYQGMDTTLRNRYVYLTDFLNGEVAPVAVVWNYLRQNHPTIELYQPDESHPSLEGSYAAACCFYAALFKKDPTLITFNPGINAADAADIRNAARTVVFDSLPQWDFKKPPNAGFRYEAGPGVNELVFHPVNHGVQQKYLWDFGDGTTDSVQHPVHSYLGNGTYTVTLTTTTCDLQGLHTNTIDTVVQFCSHAPSVSASQSWLCLFDTLWTQPADSYQWLALGVPIPETRQYLPDYSRYGSSGFSVLSTTGGCTELSLPFTQTAQWSGYYFDAFGNPCMGDTVAFAVLHINGSLTGMESILWYRNDTLQAASTNEDTLWITTPGNYRCKIIDPGSNCPLDTTSYLLTYDCGVAGMVEIDGELSWTLFPNPASEILTVQFAKQPVRETILVVDILGKILMALPASITTTVDISGLPAGLYFVRVKNKPFTLRFVRQ